MKYTLVTIAWLVFAACKSVEKSKQISIAQNQYIYIDSIDPVKMRNDTIRYLQTVIVANKQKYIGKPLEILIKDINISIVSYVASRNYPMLNKLIGVSLIFSDNEEFHSGNIISLSQCLNIIFMSQDSLEKMWTLNKKNKGIWTKDEQEYYGKQIIKDIAVPGLLLR